jgi:hypothetical protein
VGHAWILDKKVDHVMPTSREVLLSTYRTGRMKKVRMFVYVTQALLVFILFIIITMMTPGTGTDPLYLPFETYFFIIALMLLIVTAEGFFFKLFALRWAKSDSERFLASKEYTRIGIIIVVTAIIIIVLINILAPMIDESVDTEETTDVYGVSDIEFTSQDGFAITGVKSISLNSDDDYPLNIFFLRKNDFEEEVYDRRFNLDESESINIQYYEYERDNFLPFGEYVIYVDAKGETAPVTYTIKRSVSPALVLYLTIFPLIIAVMNVIWIIYLWPMKKRYEKTSIYE